MLAARNAVRICPKARVSGVAFWDRKQNVFGRAPNAIELHPIVRFEWL
jgi:hypothetical protein